jgi:hypothetical protein
MDLTKELRSMQAGENEETINQLYQEKEEISKKIYIITILQTVDIIEQMFQNKIYDKFGTSIIRIHYEYEPDVGNIINFDLLDNFEVKIPVYTKNLPKEITYLPHKTKDFLHSLNGFSDDFLSKKLQEDKEIWIDIDANVGSNVRNLLLSTELKKILDYNQMQISLGESNNNSDSKKLKL